MAAQVESIKWVVGTSFMVDGFKFQHPRCKHYFLTHQHSDHTIGLRRDFAAGVIFCSPITKTLLVQKMRIPTERVQPLEMDVRHVIDGVGVTLIDANHCPGAAMILFEVPPVPGSGKQAPTRILHCGDMRWQDSMAAHPALAGRPLDVLYLDTTYCSPRHTHPPQADCISRMVDIVREEAVKEPSTLFVIGAYSIGKERAFLGTARALGWKLWCEADKVKTMRMLRLPEEDLTLLTADKAAARIHVTFMGAALQPEKLGQRMQEAGAKRVVGFRPTGWTFKRNGKLEVRKEGAVTVYGVPYSEHSAFNELRDCVRLLRPRRIIPTVNITDDPATTRAIVDRFADLMDLSGDRTRLDSYFRAAAIRPRSGGSGSNSGGVQPASHPAAAGSTAERDAGEAGKAAACAASQPGACGGHGSSQRAGAVSGWAAEARCGDAGGPCSPMACAGSCGGGGAGADALSEGSPPPDADGGAWPLDDNGVDWEGLGAAISEADSQQQADGWDGSCAAAKGMATAENVAGGHAPPRRQCSGFEGPVGPAAAVAPRAASAPAGIEAPSKTAAQQPSGGTPVTEESFALDSVDLKQQAAIMAAIQARNSRKVAAKTAGSSGSGSASGGGVKRNLGSWASAPAVVSKAAGKLNNTPANSPRGGSGSSPADKKQRTLARFVVPHDGTAPNWRTVL